MGRIGITYHDVAKTITTLQDQQKKPTVDNIRLTLGTGSKSTIARFLREWRSKHGLQNGDDIGVPSDLLTLVKSLWDHLQDKAEKQIAEHQEHADQQVAQYQQQLKALQQENRELQTRHHQLEETCHQQNDEVNELQNQLGVEQHDKFKLIEQLKSLESRHQESNIEKDKLHQLLKNVQDNLEHYQNAMQKLHEEQTLLLEKQRNDYEQKLVVMSQQLSDVIHGKSHLEAENQHIKQTVDELQEKYQNSEQQLKHIQQQHHGLLASHETLDKAYSKLMAQHQEQSETLNKSNSIVTELKIKLEINQEKTDSLNIALSKANDKIDILRDERNFIAQEKSDLRGQLKQLTAVKLKDRVVVNA